MAHPETSPDRFFPEVFFPHQEKPERRVPSLLLQVNFLKDHWWPMCIAVGMTREQAMAVWGKWCKPIGSIFRETKVDEQEFRQTILTFAENMVLHLQALKYYMHTTEWSEVVARIEDASDPEFEFLMKSGLAHVVTIDSGRPGAEPTDEVAMSLMHVYLPNAETPGQARIRVPFAAKGVEVRVPSIEVTNNVTVTMREELRMALDAVPA
jgi:hypothetical protein